MIFSMKQKLIMVVLNLVISGIPSILSFKVIVEDKATCFKPCYKWNTFNTEATGIYMKMN